MSRLAYAILLFAAGAAASCGGGGESGLRCRGGDFYLDGREFSDCAQCPSSDCSFEANVSEVCTYPNGVQQCTITSGTVTAHCGAQRATVTISDGVFSCAGTSVGSTGTGGSGTGGAGGTSDPYADCAFPAVTATPTVGTPPTKNNSADLGGATIGDAPFDPTAKRRMVPVNVQSALAGLQAGPAYLTRTDSTSEIAYITIPVTNSGPTYYCFIQANPIQYLSGSGAVLNEATDFTYLGGSVGDLGGSLFSDTCLATGETGYFIDIQSTFGVSFFSETASVQLSLTSSSTGVAPAGHLVPQRYDVGTCSGIRALRVTGLSDGTVPVGVGDGTLAPMIFLDGSALPAGWSYVESTRTEAVQPGASAAFFTTLYSDPAVSRMHSFLDFDPPSVIQLEATPNGGGTADELQRIRNQRLDLSARWRSAVRRTTSAAGTPWMTRARNLPALGLHVANAR